MSFPVFTLLTVLGSWIWNSAFVMAGYALGANWHRIEPYTATFQYAVIAVAFGATAWFIYSRVRRRRTAAG